MRPFQRTVAATLFNASPVATALEVNTPKLLVLQYSQRMCPRTIRLGVKGSDRSPTLQIFFGGCRTLLAGILLTSIEKWPFSLGLDLWWSDAGFRFKAYVKTLSQAFSHNYETVARDFYLRSRGSQIMSYNFVETCKGCPISPETFTTCNSAKIYKQCPINS